jgi:hypothetical protein
MAATSLPREIAASIKYTYTTDSSSDWSSVPASTYFFDKTDKLVYFKTSASQVLPIFSEYNYDYLKVSISSAQILSMGTTPVSLLAAPGASFYYDIPRIIMEYTYITAPYSTGTAKQLAIASAQVAIIESTLITATSNRVAIIEPTKYENGDPAYNIHNANQLNRPLEFSTIDATNPTGGSGTLDAKIWYKIRSFG